MAQAKVCDVYGVAKGAQAYVVSIRYPNETEQQPLFTTAVDLCPRGLERLKVKIRSGTTPPIKRKRTDANNG